MSFFSDASDFEITTSFEGSNAVLAVRGRIENVAAFDLAGALAAEMDLHRRSVTLDLSELEFIGAAGLVAVANAEKRFAEAGVELAISTSSNLVLSLLAAKESSESTRLGTEGSEHDQLGVEQAGESTLLSLLPASHVSAEGLRRVTAVPADSDVVDGALRLVVELARISVRGADGVSVSLLRHGVLSTVAASDETVTEMDSDQYLTAEGPCVDASIQGRWFHARSLDTETRWPSFTPRALALGIKAILSSPLKAFERPIGALNIYSRTASTFDVEAQEAAAVFARKASIILSDARAGVTDTELDTRFQEALRSREIVAIAQGIIMERERVSQEDAFSVLLGHSLDKEVALLVGANEFIRSTVQPELGF
jgi:anti-anti-sigma regulatory factor